ncbi:MAG TPA: hypothetical protein PLF84_13415, partial [Bryobacteraceae bacterium]|nr:hypothetical protein [Bryobacteraceae bacterium]
MSSTPFPVLSPEEAAAMIHDGQTIGFSGFTPAGAAKAIPFPVLSPEEAAAMIHDGQ